MIESFLEIRLNDPQNFLKITETLTRIGILHGNTLTQSCHLFQKNGKYYIVSFIELLELDGVSKKPLTQEDLERRNGIAKLLEQWNLCTILGDAEPSSLKNTKIVKHSDRNNYQFKKNYTFHKNNKTDVL